VGTTAIGCMRRTGVVFVVRQCASSFPGLRYDAVGHCAWDRSRQCSTTQGARASCGCRLGGAVRLGRVRRSGSASGAAIVCIARHGRLNAHRARRREPRRSVGPRCREHPQCLEDIACCQFRRSHRGRESSPAHSICGGHGTCPGCSPISVTVSSRTTLCCTRRNRLHCGHGGASCVCAFTPQLGQCWLVSPMTSRGRSSIGRNRMIPLRAVPPPSWLHRWLGVRRSTLVPRLRFSPCPNWIVFRQRATVRGAHTRARFVGTTAAGRHPFAYA